MNKLLLFAVGLALVVVITTTTANAGETPADDSPAGLAEAEACALVVLERPAEWEGKTQALIGATDEAQWLTWVAWWRAHPGRDAPTTEEELASFGRLGVCVAEQLGVKPDPDPGPEPEPEPGPDPEPPPPPPPAPKPDPLPLDVPKPGAQPVTLEPSPGSYYRIHYGDELLGEAKNGGVAARAYGKNLSGGQRLVAARHINDHPYNRRFQRHQPQEGKNLFNQMRISFLPIFGDPAGQLADPNFGGEGKNYAIIYIPE